MEQLKLDEFLKYKFLSGIEFSPNGEYAAFVVHQADLEANKYRSNLWLYRPKEEQCFQLTSADNERGFIWLDDSRHILFPSLRCPKDQERQKKGEEFTVFYKIYVRGGEAREAFRLPLRVKDIKQIAGDRFLLTAVFNPRKQNIAAMPDQEKEQALKQREEEKEFEVLEEIPYWSNGGGFTSLDRSRLYLYDALSGNIDPITAEDFEVESFELNEERTRAVIVGESFTGKQEIRNSLYLLDIETKVLQRLTPPERFNYGDAHFLNDEQIICRGSSMQRFGINENAHFYLVEINTGQKRDLTPDLDRSTWNSVGSDCRYGGSPLVKKDGSHLYFVTTEGHSSYLNRIDPEGQIERLTDQEGSVDAYAVCRGMIVFIGMRQLGLQELYNLEDGGERQLTHFNDWVQERSLARPEALAVETEPGVRIDGWVMRPVNWQEGKKYPAILNIHGGPKTVYGNVFYHEMQYWANQGYFVFFCNPRGSDGKGNEFADIRGKYGTVDYEDIMAFTDRVLQSYPGIDRERLGVTGGSYGGYMTNWIIGHTDRFRAAAAQRSIANWTSMAFTTDIGYFFVEDQIAATPWNGVDKLWEHSPMKYAHRVTTPTLFIHSEQDYRCWLTEGLQMFSALKYHGVEAKLVMFRGENHELSRSGRPKQRIRRLREITEWFDKFLRL